jgi:predicted porin
MKNVLLNMTLLALASTQAFAQSSVTLYGGVDAGVTYVTNERGGNNVRLDTGNRSPDRWGFRGVEDLGGNLKATFVLENGFNLNDGSFKRSGVLFSRYAYVALSAPQGTLTLGHIPDFMYEYLRASSSGFLGSSYFFHPGNLDNQANQFQIDNAVKYETPAFHGLTLGVINGFGGQPGNFNGGRSYSFGARYANGPALLAAAYTVSNNRSFNLGQTLGLSSLLGQGLSANPAAPGATYAMFNADQTRSYGVSGRYTGSLFGPHAMYSNVKFTTPRGTASIWSAEGGLDTFLSPFDTVGVSYTYSKLDADHWNQVNLIYMHFLSKATTVYAAAAWQRAGGAAQFAVVNGLSPSNSNAQAVARIGLHHFF